MIRHKDRRTPCPVCGGNERDPRGDGKRCFGFTSDDGWVHCTREDLAGNIDQGPDQAYAHRMQGPCKCGQTHGESPLVVVPGGAGFEAEYNYRDERGTLLFQVLRRPGTAGRSKFLQRRPNGPDWIWKMDNVRRVPYLLPELLAADRSKTVFVVEGEKDVHTLVRLGEVATCNPGGADKWHLVADDARSALAGRSVVIIADADEAGRRHASAILGSLQGHAASVKILEMPRPHKDVTEFVEAGGDFGAWFRGGPVESTPVSVPDPWNLMTTAQIFEPLPPYPWLVKGLHIAPGRITLLNGYADVGKTVIAMTIALGVATGRSVWGVFGPNRTGRVLHLNGEIGLYIARERYQRLARGMGVDEADLIRTGNLVLSNYPAARLDDKDFESELALKCRGCELVIIDSLRAFSGALNENAPEVGVALFKLARVSALTGATIVVLHHNRKPSKDSMGGAKADIAGNVAILGGAECAFVMVATEKGGPIVVSHERSPIGKPLEDFGLQIQDIERDGDPRWGLRVVHLEPQQLAGAREQASEKAERVRRETAFAKATKGIFAVLKTHAGVYRGSKDGFRASCGVGAEPFRAALDQLISVGCVTESRTDYHKTEWHLVREL